MRIRYSGRLWDVDLCDDGTMDTVIAVCPVRGDHSIEEIRFTLDGDERHPDGALKLTAFRWLAREACEGYLCRADGHEHCEYSDR